MAESILINFTPQETRVAILEQGIVQELHVERHSTRGLVGNIYLGRIVRILPGMQSAFVDIGLERTAFLHVADILQARIGDVANRESRPIEEVISEGQTLLVQVIKDPIGTKGARLSTQVSIAGRMLVYLPQEKHIGISQRIESETEREALIDGYATAAFEQQKHSRTYHHFSQFIAEHLNVAFEADPEAELELLQAQMRELQGMQNERQQQAAQ